MKKFINSRFGIRAAKGSVAAGAVLLATNANAALPTEAQDALDATLLWVTDMTAAAWPIVGALTAALIGIKLFKKFTNRAT